MLEIVGVNITRIKRLIGDHIIGKLDDLEGDAVLFEQGFDVFEDLGVRGRGCADLQGDRLGCSK